MEEKKIELKTAKLAKEKGFDIPCYHFYDLYDRDDNDNISTGCIDNWNSYKSCSAPTKSLLQKWLREVHKIDVFCDCIGSGKYFSVIFINDGRIDDKVFEQDEVSDYETALEIGLQEALKLIP